MNLFNILNRRYGQSYIKEVRSWEGKEHKLTKHKCHLHFNLRCLSQNIVPKGVKLNIKQFTTFQEKTIICKTHRSILNSCVRQCNRIIDNLKLLINKIKASVKSKCNNSDFIEVNNTIIKSQEKVFKSPNMPNQKILLLQKSPKYRNTPVPDILRKKWVINLSSKPLSDGEQSLLQKGPKFAVSFFQSCPHWVHCSYKKNLGWAWWEYCRKGLHRDLPKNQRSLTTLQEKEGAHSQHH